MTVRAEEGRGPSRRLSACSFKAPQDERVWCSRCSAPCRLLSIRDLKPRLAIGAELAAAFGEEAGADLAGVTLGGLKIGIPLASTMGGDEAIALHVGRMTARPAGSCPCGQASPGRVSTTAGRAPRKRKGRPDRPPFAFACTGIPRISASRTRPPGSVPSSPDRALRRASARGRRSPCRPRRRHSRGSHARAGSALRR